MIFAVVALLAGVPASVAVRSHSAGELRLTDDRGQALASPIQACFQIALRQECSELPARALLALPGGFESLQLEGDDYGPLSARPADIASALSASAPLVVPRKGTVRVRGPLGAPTTLALYSLDAPDSRHPAFQRQLPPEGTVTVPAGEFLAALSREALAPDLHVVSIQPGAQTQLSFAPRPGWSLALRVRERESGKPVPAVEVELRGVEGFSAPGRVVTGKTDRSGFAIWSGLQDAVMRADLRHPRFVAQEVNGLLASPGTFAYQQARLERGGSIRATIRLEGKPVANARCEVVRYPRNRVRGAAPEKFYEGFSDRTGVCASGRLAEGSYFFRASETSHGAKALTSIAVSEGDVTPLDVDLYPIHVTGTVRQGSQPGEGFRVLAYDLDAQIPAAEAADAPATATSDEEGEYVLELWSAGDYVLSLVTAKGVSAQARRLERLVGDEVVDFQLDEATVFGVVEDDAGRPLPGARVALRWQTSGRATFRAAWPGADGTFSFPMETTGPVEIVADKIGYRSSQPLALEFVAGSALGPLRLVLRKENTVRGIVIGPTGIPIAGAEVTIGSAGAGGGQRWLGTAASDSQGSFEIVLPGPAVTEGFVGGPGCPLTSFEAPPPDQEWRINCANAPAAFSVTILDEQGKPLPAASFILKVRGHVLPAGVVARHQGIFGSPTQTDASGRLVFIALAPGDYGIYLSGSTNEGLVASGASLGYLGSYSLAPLRLTEAEAQVTWERTLVEAPK